MAGYRVKADEARGLSIGLIRLQLGTMRGVAIGGYSRMHVQRGLAIVVYNRADVLQGLQIGLLNYAGNARFEYLPIVNAVF